MNIIAKAKPIRIRVVSGGEEHFSLDTLRQNLCVQDIFPLIRNGRLSRWLNQNGENDLSERIKRIENTSSTELDERTCYDILRILLKDETSRFNAADVYKLYSCWHDSALRGGKNYRSLQKYLLTRPDGVKYIHGRYKNELSDEEWMQVFTDLGPQKSSYVLYWQGQLLYNGYKRKDGSTHQDRHKAYALMEQAAKLGVPEAMKFVKSSRMYTKWEDLTLADKEEIDKQINLWKSNMFDYAARQPHSNSKMTNNVIGFLQELSRFLYKTPSIGTFIPLILADPNPSLYFCHWEKVTTTYTDLKKDDVFYRERRFILGLAEYNLNGTLDIFQELKDCYPLAKYMLDPTKGILEITGGIDFANESSPNQLRFIVDHLFQY